MPVMTPEGIRKACRRTLQAAALFLLLAGAGPLFGETVTLPVAASLVRPVAPFFSDVRVFNTSYTSVVTVTAVYRCFGCASAVAPQVFTLQARESKAFDDICNQLFGVPNSIGAVEFSTPAATGSGAGREGAVAGAAGIVVTSRLYSPLAPPATSGSVGMFIPGLPSSSAKVVTALTNLMTGDFRTNIGVYNPNAVAVTATVRLFDGPVLLGTVPVTLGPQTGGQVNDIYGQLKFGALKTTNGYCTVESGAETAPLFTYAVEADNTTQDTIFVVGAEDVPAPPGFNPPTATASVTPTVTPTASPGSPTPTPSATPTPAPGTETITINVRAWDFSPGGPVSPPIVLKVGTTYRLVFHNVDTPQTTNPRHGFSGISDLGLPGSDNIEFGKADFVIPSFTPQDFQRNAYPFACTNNNCGGDPEQHVFMLGVLIIQ
jgi:hypothetical protein